MNVTEDNQTGNLSRSKFLSTSTKGLRSEARRVYAPSGTTFSKKLRSWKMASILGPVGGRIVGEVIIGLLQLDRDSYLADTPPWRPSLPQRGAQVTETFGWWIISTLQAWLNCVNCMSLKCQQPIT
jgi:hypothetical protein